VGKKTGTTVKTGTLKRAGKLFWPGLMFVCLAFCSCASLQEKLQELSEAISASFSADDDGPDAPAQGTDKRSGADDAHWDIAALDTARGADYLSGVEKDVILEMNKVRTNPSKYAELYIKPRLKYFFGTNYSVPGKITIATKEGKKAVEECIAALSRARPAAALLPERGLARAAKDHAADQGPKGATGHGGSDRSSPAARISRYGKMGNTMGENISYGDNSGREIVCSLLIDDGVPNRGHRTNIMNKTFSQCGTGFGRHKAYRSMCVIVYAHGYTSAAAE
jgi:uncharacterized protein YkwD